MSLSHDEAIRSLYLHALIRLLLPLLLALAVVGCTAPPAPRGPLVLDDWHQVGARDFERDHPGLGYSRRYEARQGWIDVYGYNLRHDWQEGLADPKFRPTYGTVVEEIHQALKKAGYAKIRRGRDEVRTYEQTEMMRVRFTFVAKGEPIESYLYFSALNGNLMKVRATLRSPVRDEAREKLEAFLPQLVRFFRETEKPYRNRPHPSPGDLHRPETSGSERDPSPNSTPAPPRSGGVAPGDES
ncbi:MAG: hypothetical protein U1F61_30645 [Opitutaceae bacterium]